jgi:3-deoxy-manno-octulosonate cytidylyltransferase (CMP-KDO synthetase)
MKVIAIIPARYGSTRFPGKPLADVDGQSMISRVIDQVRGVSGFAEVIVATDDKRIADHVNAYGARVVMTSPDHPSGTDRCLEALDMIATSADAIINIQGDEPFVAHEQLELLLKMLQNPFVDIATLCIKITENEVLFDPNKVKVVFGSSGKALYFSRNAIPFQKSVAASDWLKHHTYFKHIGLYAYKTSVLRNICHLKPSPLELAESLEQLRWLENGHAIYLGETSIETPAIDTPEDLQKALTWLKSR